MYVYFNMNETGFNNFLVASNKRPSTIKAYMSYFRKLNGKNHADVIASLTSKSAKNLALTTLIAMYRAQGIEPPSELVNQNIETIIDRADDRNQFRPDASALDKFIKAVYEEIPQRQHVWHKAVFSTTPRKDVSAFDPILCILTVPAAISKNKKDYVAKYTSDAVKNAIGDLLLEEGAEIFPNMNLATIRNKVNMLVGSVQKKRREVATKTMANVSDKSTAELNQIAESFGHNLTTHLQYRIDNGIDKTKLIELLLVLAKQL